MAGEWRVISQRQYEELTPQGTFESTVEVSFQLTSGTTGSVKIPARMYTEEYVRQVVGERAAVMTAVENL